MHSSEKSTMSLSATWSSTPRMAAALATGLATEQHNVLAVTRTKPNVFINARFYQAPRPPNNLAPTLHRRSQPHRIGKIDALPLFILGSRPGRYKAPFRIPQPPQPS